MIAHIKSTSEMISMYSPIIVVVAVMFWGFVINAPIKSFAYFTIVTIITAFQMWMVPAPTDAIDVATNANNASGATVAVANAMCSTGANISGDPTYSTLILSFTLLYLLAPMLMNGGGVNFGAIGFLSAMLMYDAGVRIRLNCAPWGAMAVTAAGGGLLGAGIGLLFYACARSFVYVNAKSSDTETCNVPNKQQFKCRVYKNGELVTQ